MERKGHSYGQERTENKQRHRQRQERGVTYKHERDTILTL